MRTRNALIALLAASSLLAACSKAPEQAPENQQSEAPKPVAPPPKPAAKPLPAPEAKPEPVKAKAAPEPTADQQMIDDADATGMTSHTSRDASTTNETNSN